MGTGLLNTILLAQQHFCGPNLIRSFACELPPVLLLACSDPSVSVFSILTTMVVLGLGTFVILVGSYTRIILTALGMNSATGWNKIFSTCSSHFLVVTIFYGSGISRFDSLHSSFSPFPPYPIDYCPELERVDEHFCGPNLILSFACEFPPVLLLACSDPSMSVASILTTMVVLGLGTFVLVLVSYTHIIMTALGIDSASGQNKIFSTCSSHVLVVTIFYGSGIFRYMTPASGSALEQVLSMQYSVVTPLLNPLIYSLKNQEVKAALRRMLSRKPRLTF
ncbi:hypothetical protein JEQ12_014431 [Ovis aries]|uniref:Olfactory receptor 8S1-like n=1 Tax=Ovis aries TaxID=9940 RepID=A0A836D7T8_SHEEP|nr:hypothetical protein JEQ12_014431 [Ovis aries]